MYPQALSALARVEPPDCYGPRASYLAGEALRALGRYEEALEMYQRAADFEPEDVKHFVAIGACHKHLGQIDLAIEAMEDALIVEPGNPLVLYHLACYWSLAARRRRALNFLSRAVELDGKLGARIDSEDAFAAIRDDPRFRKLARPWA